MVERVGLVELVGLVGLAERVELVGLVALRRTTPHTHTAPPAELLKLVEGVVQLGKQLAAGGRLERVGLVRRPAGLLARQLTWPTRLDEHA